MKLQVCCCRYVNVDLIFAFDVNGASSEQIARSKRIYKRLAASSEVLPDALCEELQIDRELWLRVTASALAMSEGD